MYDHVTHHKTITVNKGSDQIINEGINVLWRSMKSLLLLLSEPHAGGARDPKKFFNPDITCVQVSVNGVPNKVYSQGIKGRHMWGEVKRHCGKSAGSAEARKSNMDATKFYTGDKFNTQAKTTRCTAAAFGS